LKGDGVGARSCNDFIWSKEFIREFLGRSCCVEELSLDKCLGTNLEFQSWRTSSISWSLVMTSGFVNVLLELLVYLFEVCDKIVCMHSFMTS